MNYQQHQFKNPYDDAHATYPIDQYEYIDQPQYNQNSEPSSHEYSGYPNFNGDSNSQHYNPGSYYGYDYVSHGFNPYDE